MYSHMMVGTNDLEKSKAFYDAVFKAIGGPDAFQDPKGRYFWLHNARPLRSQRPSMASR